MEINMKKILSRLSSLLKDGSDEHWSSTRFILLFTVLVSNICIFGAWVFVSISQKHLASISSELITIYSLANGITLTGKVVQKWREK
jgi:hypothetical protein